MPSSAIFEAFAASVERNAHAEATQQFYAADATMQENTQRLRQGRTLFK